MRGGSMWAGFGLGVLVLAGGCTTPPADEAGEVEAVVVTGSRVRDGRGAPALEPAPAPLPAMEPAPPPVMAPAAGMESAAAAPLRAARAPDGSGRGGVQAGLLTAADHDDLLNSGLYRDYADRHLRLSGDSQAPRLDVAGRVVVRVLDREGRPVAFAPVTAGEVTLATAANGEAVFFPGLDDLGAAFTVRAAPPGAAPAAARVNARELGPDRTVVLRTAAAAAAPRALDLALVVDTTGSMDDELAYLQTELTSILGSLSRSAPGVDTRVAVIVYRDVGDDYVVRTSAFTGDVRAARAFLEAQDAAGGGDYPEAVDQALEAALDLRWRPDAVKVMMHVADAPPHAGRAGRAWAAARRARLQRIHIVPVAASGVAAEAEYLMRGAAALTQSRYLFLTNDSGVGRPKEEPDVDCYVVTRLDSLIRRVLTQLVTGRRVEPEPPEVIRTVGVYDRGVCRAG